ncbi:DUF4082 domain-containing protein [Pseudarthrobacter siccitolerans]|uniref:DUF4082 domain-containing protein n=1 Tax=Pseudarthrobacter siccitolerans TaxID=861266 RepID=UPI001F1C3C67|nr:DUF4082 domain-containing protein [Pseudarthrobacter siccitolerans]
MTFNQSVTGSSVVFGLKNAAGASVSGSVAYEAATNKATFTPTAALAFNTVYTATVSGATNSSGQVMAAPFTWSFTTAAAPACPCTVFSPSSLPAVISVNDGNAVELGMKFRSDVAGSVTGVRFYKGPTNSGTHTGHLWSAGGALLATVTFTGETGSGWQQANFATPVAITANTTYVVSYFAPNGNYAATGAFFANSADNAPLHGLASGMDGLNGVYRYGASAFPGESYNNTNYWVDAVFSAEASAPAPAVTTVTPANNSTGVAVEVKPTVKFNQAVTPSSIVFAIKDSANTNVAGSTAYDAATNTSTFTPTATLAYNTQYTATVSGAANSGGQAMNGPFSWAFMTTAAAVLPSVASVTPANNTSNVAVDTKPTAAFNQDVAASSVIFTVKNAANAAVPGAVSYNAATRTATFAPAATLANGTTYTATVSGAANSTGQTMGSPYTWTFSTRAASATVFPPEAVPATVSTADGNAVELGMKFRADTAGIVTGVRFYKGESNAGPHTGRLWTSTGILLADVTFTEETASGWQEALFASPVPIAADTTYVVSYFAPEGFYSSTGGYFTSSADRAPLHGLASGTDGLNGVYRYGASAYPTESHNNTNYWVDVVFHASTTGQAPIVTAASPSDGTTGVPVSVKPTVTFNQAVNGSAVAFSLKNAAGATVPGSATYDAATNTAVFSPAAALAFSTSYTATVSGATNDAGTTMPAPHSWSFTTSAAPTACPCSVFGPTATPATANTNDKKAVEVGMKFRSDVAGMVTGVRFFKGSANVGTHVGHLWSATGTLLASVTFTGETSSGWQQAMFTTPVPITANTTYVVSYYAPVGSYSSTRDYFTKAVDRAPLHGLASGVDGANGVFGYGTASFPTDSFRNTNYWVDVVFNAS